MPRRIVKKDKIMYKKYFSGAGLDKIALTNIYNLLEKLDSEKINIIEFGSGYSTQFLIDYKLYSDKNITIDSFDDSKEYAYKNKNNYKFLNLYIRPLLTCTDENFKKTMENKCFNNRWT